MIAVVDYSAGNLRSVVNAVERLGYTPQITSEPEVVRGADVVILPGVGAAADTMANLNRLGLVASLKQVIAEGKPFMGICMGLQLLFTGTEEGGWHECLGVFPGRVRRLPPGLKIPHMGWNQVKQTRRHPVLAGIPDNTDFYFVHSYYVDAEDRSLVAGETDYGVSFCSMIARGNLVATQFHPEKSGEMGLKLYDNFLKMALGKAS
ncbi:MAG: imidazole glycerol phosphate synthase subunit HisH [Chloroflexota bacterium]